MPSPPSSFPLRARSLARVECLSGPDAGDPTSLPAGPVCAPASTLAAPLTIGIAEVRCCRVPQPASGASTANFAGRSLRVARAGVPRRRDGRRHRRRMDHRRYAPRGRGSTRTAGPDAAYRRRPSRLLCDRRSRDIFELGALRRHQIRSVSAAFCSGCHCRRTFPLLPLHMAVAGPMMALRWRAQGRMQMAIRSSRCKNGRAASLSVLKSVVACWPAPLCCRNGARCAGTGRHPRRIA